MSGEREAWPTLSPDLRRRLIEAADRPLRVRRNVLLLAAHATGHMKHPHGESCETCKEVWPCVAVKRAAGPSLNAFAECDQPSADDLDALVAAARRDAAAEGAEKMLVSIRREIEDWCDLPRMPAHQCTALIAAHDIGLRLRERHERLLARADAVARGHGGDGTTNC